MTDAIQKAREALVAARKSFEEIRIILIGKLSEPERSAFWKAVNGRTAAADALAALDAETPVTPDDVGELVETLLAYALDEDGDVELSHENVLSAATALERVVRERDDARAEIERMTPQFVAYEYLESPAGREIAEAKLAEARKVIEPFVAASEAHKAAVERYNARLIVVKEERARDDWSGRMDAYEKAVDDARRAMYAEMETLRSDARRFLEETK